MIFIVNSLISPGNFTFGSSSSYSDDLEEDFLTEEDLNGNYSSVNLNKLLLTDANNVSGILTKELQTSITSDSSGILSKVLQNNTSNSSGILSKVLQNNTSNSYGILTEELQNNTSKSSGILTQDLQNSTSNSSGILNELLQSNTYDIMSIAPTFMNDSTNSKSNDLEGSTAKAPELPNIAEIKDSQDFQADMKGSDDEPDIQGVHIYPEDVYEISNDDNVEINDYEKDDTGEKFIQGKFEINKKEELDLATINKAMEELFDESNFTNLGNIFILYPIILINFNELNCFRKWDLL